MEPGRDSKLSDQDLVVFADIVDIAERASSGDYTGAMVALAMSIDQNPALTITMLCGFLAGTVNTLMVVCDMTRDEAVAYLRKRGTE